jgi:histidine ammonia-lyase
MTEPLVLDARPLDAEEVLAAAARRPLVLGPRARERLAASAATVARLAVGPRAHYGVNTGFGALARERIPAEDVRRLQYNLARSHAVGTGDPLGEEDVRLLMILKAHALSFGLSGVRPLVVETLLAFLNAGVHPRIPSRGSVGASGDLAPLAHLTLALIGEGEGTHEGRILSGPALVAAAGVAPLVLEAKEALALLNGTQLSLTLLLRGVARARRLLDGAIAAGALSVEALAASRVPFDARIQEARNQEGQKRVAAVLRAWLGETSPIARGHADCGRVQDPYSLRCLPQVLGAACDALTTSATLARRELNAVSDNPLVFGDEILSGGNFHAAPLAWAADALGIAIATTTAMAERRCDLYSRRVNPALPPFLAERPGLESGWMIAQVTAAALASESKTLAHPASVDSIPTSAGQEDHVSMAPWAGLKLARLLDRLALVLGIECSAACRALEIVRPLRASPPLEELYGRLRARARAGCGDRRLDEEIHAFARALEDDALLDGLPRLASPFVDV